MKKFRIPRKRNLRCIVTFGRQGGFTFLEVMISLAVLAACLLVLLNLQSLTVDQFAESRSMTEALMLARSKMVETEAGGFPELGKDEGDFGEKHPGYMWIRDVTETGVDVLRKVRIVVLPPGGDYEPGTVQLETLLARVEYAPLAELMAGSGGGPGSQGGPQSGSTGDESTGSSGGAASSPGKAPSGAAKEPAPQNPAAVFLPWLSPNAPRNPPPRPSGPPPAFLPWLSGGGGSQ
ncbi:MAG: prepilin-type N-terminal cleavage/methylation domain-containing protein [Deltaproteobacteria bacterium]|nr:prepilin-type N-terminal cleavage/methylation domain-containing protein [Deltaproteobacteria bacterium]MBW2309185.1 prepilin-type N-terminal cleavage/methylation domain-containing protein [Deltaproteobacteria bacterium]